MAGKAWSDFALPYDVSRLFKKMTMLNINKEIEQLHQLITSPPDAITADLFGRLYAWGVLSLFNKVNNELENLSERLDTFIELDAMEIKFDTYCNEDYWTPYWNKQPKTTWPSDNLQTAINRMTDYLPNGQEGYQVTPEVLGSFKTAMHQLCDEERMSTRAVTYALDKGIDTIRQLLDELRRKVENPESYLYGKLWDELSKTHCEDNPNYEEWRQEIGTPTIEDLKAKQKQEIYNLLKKEFFRFAHMPTGGEVKKRKTIIGEDDLEVGSVIDKDFETNCAKLDRYVVWKGDCVLTVNYERLGQYIYKNYKKFDKADFVNIVDFDATIELINEDMAKIKPDLAQHLKRYQERQLEELLKDCMKIFEPFKMWLKDDIRQTIIDEYLEMLLFDSKLKEEARRSLRGQSKNKYCCSIMIALSFCYIFKPEYTTAEYAEALYEVLSSVQKDTLERYFKDQKNNNEALNKWTADIMNDLKTVPYSRLEVG